MPGIIACALFACCMRSVALEWVPSFTDLEDNSAFVNCQEVKPFKLCYVQVGYLFHFLIVGCFKPGENGTILKKSTDKERECLVKLMKDILRPYIPDYKREVNKGGERILCTTKNVSFIFIITVMY